MLLETATIKDLEELKDSHDCKYGRHCDYCQDLQAMINRKQLKVTQADRDFVRRTDRGAFI